MFVSILFNTEYMDLASRKTWYLKNLLHCKDNGWILITHEYMKTHFEEIQSAILPSLFSSWEIRPFTAEEVQSVEQYFVPDELFEQLEAQAGSRTEFLYQLSSEDSPVLESALQEIFDDIRKKHSKDKIDGVFHCLESWKCIRSVCDRNDLTLIPYSFSAIRKPHGYRQTLFHTNLTECMYSTKECKGRYNSFVAEEGSDSLPVFSHRELIAMLGKERTLPLIPLMNKEPKYEMGLCTECFSLIPQFFVQNKHTDDDVRFACEKLYNKDEITVRNHAAQVDYMRLDRTTVHNDPAAWILSSRRLSAARSQIMLKVLLWNRTAIVKPDTFGFSFMCEKDYRSTNKVDIRALNYYIFGYLIPNDLMFDGAYWKWRMTQPTEVEIYNKHLQFYISKLGLSGNFTKNEPECYLELLQDRGCDSELIATLQEDSCDFDIDYNTANSRFVINGKSYWRINKLENGLRHCHIEVEKGIDGFEFYPLDDVAGCTRIAKVLINDEEQNIPQSMMSFNYFAKTKDKHEFHVDSAKQGTIIDIYWDYEDVKTFLEQ